MMIKEILHLVKTGKLSIEEATELIKEKATLEINGHTLFDVFREHRTGINEVVFGYSKSFTQLKEIIQSIPPSTSQLLITKVPRNTGEKLQTFIDNSKFDYHVKTSHDLSTWLISREPIQASNSSRAKNKVLVLAAGTSDQPILEETTLALEYFKVPYQSFIDVGIAGIHRLENPLKELKTGTYFLLIVIAGMEGALPSILASLTTLPIIGVPTSTGYGIGGKGIAALLSMLQSCSPGITLVNIDGGFQAAAFAKKMYNTITQIQPSE